MATVKYNLGTVGGMAVTELWSGTTGATGGITLNDDITNYKFLVFDFKTLNGADNIYFTKLISAEQMKKLINNNNVFISFVWGYSSNNDYFNLVYGTTTKILHYSASITQCTRIVGIN